MEESPAFMSHKCVWSPPCSTRLAVTHVTPAGVGNKIGMQNEIGMQKKQQLEKGADLRYSNKTLRCIKEQLNDIFKIVEKRRTKENAIDADRISYKKHQQPAKKR